MRITRPTTHLTFLQLLISIIHDFLLSWRQYAMKSFPIGQVHMELKMHMFQRLTPSPSPEAEVMSVVSTKQPLTSANSDSELTRSKWPVTNTIKWMEVTIRIPREGPTTSTWIRRLTDCICTVPHAVRTGRGYCCLNKVHFLTQYPLSNVP
jgi:hypothetical protein